MCSRVHVHEEKTRHIWGVPFGSSLFYYYMGSLIESGAYWLDWAI